MLIISAQSAPVLTRVAHPFLKRFLQATHVEWFGRHAD